MPYLTERFLQKPILRSQFLRLALISLVLMALQATTARAQCVPANVCWQAYGSNISNTNSGNFGIGATNPSYKLVVGPDIGPGLTTSDLTVSRGTGQSVSAFVGANGSNGMNFGWDQTNQRAFVNAPAQSPITFTHGGVNERMRIATDGNVGIGINAPSTKLHVVGDGKFTGALSVGGNSQARTPVMSLGGFSTGDAGTDIAFSAAGTGTLYLSTYKTGIGYGNIALQPEGGNVGIGTPSPSASYKLDVNGDTHVTGNINAKFQDVAEWVESSQVVPAGTVVVLDHTKSNQVVASSQAYDTRVAGVISERPGIALGESGDSKVLVATTGRVRVKVDATHSPIHVGDLLVTSDVPGLAMKSEPVNIGGVQLHRPGTLIGKALEPLEKGSGTILVLLSLQ